MQFTLERETLDIEGVLVGEGELSAGLRVGLVDETPAGTVSFDFRGRRATAALSVERLARVAPGRALLDPFVEPGPDGGFAVTGLAARAYSLRIEDPRTLASTVAGPFVAGARGLRVPAPPRPGPLAGLVVTEEGTPLAGVTVHARRIDVGGAVLSSRSDSDGRIRFPALARQGVAVRVDPGPGWVQRDAGVPLPNEGDVQITVERAARVEIALEPVGPLVGATAVAFEDGRGARIQHVVDDLVKESRASTPLDPPRADGRVRPLPLRVPLRAREILVLRGDEVLLRSPLRLNHGETAVVEL